MKRFFLCAVITFIIAVPAFSQDTTGWKFAQTITQDDLKDLLYIVASEQMQGRETGTEGQRRAAIYLQSQFEKMGLKAPEALEGYQQKYLLYRDSLISQQLEIGERQYEQYQDFVLLTGNDLSGHIRSNQIVFAGYGIEDKNYSDYNGKNVKGKIVVVMDGEPMKDGSYLVSGSNKRSVWGYSYRRKARVAAEKGALGVIFVNAGMENFSSRMINGVTSSRLYYPKEDSDDDGIPIVYLLPKYLQDIFGQDKAEKILSAAKESQALKTWNIKSGKDVAIDFQKKRFSVLASNILGIIEGTDLKDQYVFVTAHYDHLGTHGGKIYFGADDDGSGTVSVLEIAEAFKKAKEAGHGPRRTMVFMLVSGEEKGLWGSEYYTDHPIFPLDKTSVDLNIDMVGRIDPGRKEGDSTNYVYVIGNDKLSSDLDPITKSVNDKYTDLELDFKFNDPDDPLRIYYRSDHYNFAKNGVPIIFYFDGIHKDYHKPSDTPDKINYDLMEKRARYIFMVAWNIANRDEMLKRDIPLPETNR